MSTYMQTYKGVDVCVDNKGQFTGRLSGTSDEISEPTLCALKARIDKAKLTRFVRTKAVVLGNPNYDCSEPSFVEITSIDKGDFRHKGGKIFRSENCFVDDEAECAHLRDLVARRIEIGEQIKQEATRLRKVLSKVTPEMVEPGAGS